MPKKKPQPQLFAQENGDLPLFSGTAPKAVESRFNPQPVAQQGRLLQCQTCQDTGYLKTGGRFNFCLCQAGQKQRIVRDCLGLSGSTMATLTGFTDARADQIQGEFAAWVGAHSTVFKNWMQAWDAFQEARK